MARDHTWSGFYDLLKKADADPFINGYMGDRKHSLKIIGNTEGLLSIEDFNGVKKVSAVYIVPESRGKGLAGRAINTYVGNAKSFAFIDPMNIASQLLFKNLGYIQTGSRPKDGIEYQLWERNST